MQKLNKQAIGRSGRGSKNDRRRHREMELAGKRSFISQGRRVWRGNPMGQVLWGFRSNSGAGPMLEAKWQNFSCVFLTTNAQGGSGVSESGSSGFVCLPEVSAACRCNLAFLSCGQTGTASIHQLGVLTRERFADDWTLRTGVIDRSGKTVDVRRKVWKRREGVDSIVTLLASSLHFLNS